MVFGILAGIVALILSLPIGEMVGGWIHPGSNNQTCDIFIGLGVEAVLFLPVMIWFVRRWIKRAAPPKKPLE
ncbi:MAG: hypothetical protein IT462_11675 [Planctomycetes bacterium]|nr:hypothetical protein [Planctomycetota bacterium]